jgi:hypothetical protein
MKRKLLLISLNSSFPLVRTCKKKKKSYFENTFTGRQFKKVLIPIVPQLGLKEAYSKISDFPLSPSHMGARKL